MLMLPSNAALTPEFRVYFFFFFVPLSYIKMKVSFARCNINRGCKFGGKDQLKRELALDGL